MASGGGQTTVVALDKALPATRLLEKRRLMFQVQEALERKKVEFASKEEELTRREEALRLKDRELQDSLIGFSKFLQENNIKRIRAEKKAADEIRLQAEKAYYKSAISEILNLENDVACAKQAYERKRHETAEMEKKMDSILQISAAKTLVRGQACMAAENLFNRVCRNSKINHVPQTSPLRQLDVVGDYVSDTNQIIKAVKAGALKKDEVGF